MNDELAPAPAPTELSGIQMQMNQTTNEVSSSMMFFI
jgi:hypothetical protein